MSRNQENIDLMKERMQILEKESSTLCLAKWFQSTIYLFNGHTHSCHHPRAHLINPESLKDSPEALHNTPQKVKAREDLKNNIQTKECIYCWNIENLGKNFLSDRTYKSVDNWSFPHREKIFAPLADQKIAPTYLEVSFENSCNMKCIYCSPEISSRWMNEVEKAGPYHLFHNKLFHDKEQITKRERWPISPEEYNPYTEAFWLWWPTLKDSLHTFRITGGEPLLSKHTWRILDDLILHPKLDLHLAINTNLSVQDELIDKLIAKLILVAPNVGEVSLYTSCEAEGAACEYIRYGMSYSQFMKNVEKVLDQTPEKVRINFMSSISAPALGTFPQFLTDLAELRKKVNPNKNFLSEYNRLPLMIAYIRDPNFLDVRVLSSEVKSAFISEVLKVVTPGQFYLEEIDQINRLCEFMNSEIEDLPSLLTDFFLYFKEMDKRRNSDFVKTFPELETFYNYCRKIAYKKLILQKISSE